MGAVKDVLVATGACHRCDLAAVEADADVADELRRWGRGGVRHRAAEMEALKTQEKEKKASSTWVCGNAHLSLLMRSTVGVNILLLFFFTQQFTNRVSSLSDCRLNKWSEINSFLPAERTFITNKSLKEWKKSRYRYWERLVGGSGDSACHSMNYRASCLHIMFDLIPTSLCGGAACHYAKMNMNEQGGAPTSALKHTVMSKWKRTRVWTHWAAAWDHAFINHGSG